MKDENKTKKQLLNELTELRQIFAELGKLEKRERDINEALRESEARYRALFDRTLYCVFVHDFEGKFLDANDAALNLLGYSREEIPSLNFSYFLDKDQLTIAFKTLEEIRLTGSQKYPLEYKLKKKNGDYVWVETEASLIYKEGKPYAVQGIARDITERKLTEEILKGTEEKLRNIIEHSNEIFYIHDIHHKLLFASPQSVSILGYTPDEMMTEWTNLVTENPINEIGIEITEKAIKTGKRQEPYLLELYHKDGRRVLLEIDESPYKDSVGKVIGIVGAARDITLRNQVEKALRESEEKFRILAETNTTSIIIFQKDKFLYVNPATETLTGYTNEELMKMSLWDIIHPEFRELVKERELAHQRGEIVNPTYEFKIITKNGDIRWVTTTGGLIDFNGIPAVIGTAFDITEKKMIEEALKESEKKYRDLANNALVGIYQTNIKGDLMYVNEALSNVLGFESPEEIIEEGAIKRYKNPKDRETLIKNLLEWKSVKNFEVELLSKTGKVINVLLSANLDDDIISGMIIDITERKRAEEALQKNEAKLAEAQKIAHLGVFEFEVPLGNVWFSKEMMRILGLDANQRVPTIEEYMQFVHPDDRALVKSVIERTFTEKLPFDYEYRLLLSNGIFKHIHCVGYTTEDKDGNVIGIWGTIQDITERKRIIEDLRYRLEFEKLITSFSTNFINITPEDTDKWINIALKTVGEFVGVDRSYVFLFSEDGTKMDNTHEWCSNGIEPQIQRLQGLSIDSFPWFAERIRVGTVIHIPRVSDLPPEASAEKEEFNTAEIKSLINVPVIYRKLIVGFLGFDSVQEEKTWSEDHIILLKILGEIFFNALIHKRTEEALRQSEKRYRTLFMDSREAICINTRDGKFIDVNQSALDLFGYTREEMIMLNVLNLYVDPDDRYRFQQEIEQTGSVRNYEVKFRRKDGTEIDCLLTSTIRKTIDGKILGYQGIIRDITEVKKIENQLRYMSMHDPLTSLYNRAYFEEEMHRVESGRYDSAGIIMCDVDGLKLVNDALGHYTGDSLLQVTAHILKESFREGDVIARVGGDEFAILLPNSDMATLDFASKRIREAIEKYNSFNPKLPLSISIGLAISNEKPIIISNLFKEADNNMYREKLDHSLSARSTIVQTLMKALETRDFVIEGHVNRLQKLVAALANAIGLREQSITDLRLLAEFHDIGKVGIPDNILFKSDIYTLEETNEMRRHCEIGHRIALCTPDLVPIADLILKHHEWWDGKGYPLGLKGKEIPLECRIFSIAEAYEAMTNYRPQRNPISQEEAIEELRRNAGIQFDPELVYKFVDLLEREII